MSEWLARHLAGLTSCALGVAALGTSLILLLSGQRASSLPLPDHMTLASWSEAVTHGLQQVGPAPIVLFLLSLIAAVSARARGEGSRWLWAVGIASGACALVVPVVLAALALLFIVAIIVAVITGG